MTIHCCNSITTHEKIVFTKLCSLLWSPWHLMKQWRSFINKENQGLIIFPNVSKWLLKFKRFWILRMWNKVQPRQISKWKPWLAWFFACNGDDICELGLPHNYFIREANEICGFFNMVVMLRNQSVSYEILFGWGWSKRVWKVSSLIYYHQSMISYY